MGYSVQVDGIEQLSVLNLISDVSGTFVVSGALEAGGYLQAGDGQPLILRNLAGVHYVHQLKVAGASLAEQYGSNANLETAKSAVSTRLGVTSTGRLDLYQGGRLWDNKTLDFGSDGDQSLGHETASGTLAFSGTGSINAGGFIISGAGAGVASNDLAIVSQAAGGSSKIEDRVYTIDLAAMTAKGNATNAEFAPGITLLPNEWVVSCYAACTEAFVGGGGIVEFKMGRNGDNDELVATYGAPDMGVSGSHTRANITATGKQSGVYLGTEYELMCFLYMNAGRMFSQLTQGEIETHWLIGTADIT